MREGAVKATRLLQRQSLHDRQVEWKLVEQLGYNEKYVGAAAWRQGSGFRSFCNLDIHATVFQAELAAIAKCA